MTGSPRWKSLIARSGLLAVLLPPLWACQTSTQDRLATIQKHLDEFGRTGDPRWRDRAIAKLRKEVRREPGSAGAYLLLCVTLFDRAIYDNDEAVLPEARGACESALSLDPGAASRINPPSYATALTYINIASRVDMARSEKYYDKAIEELNTTIRERPDFSLAHLQLGRIYLWQQHRELALFEAREAVRVDPASAAAHLVLGRVFVDAIHTEGSECYDHEAAVQATASLKEAVRLAPNSAEAHRELSVAFEHLGRFELAVFEAERARKLGGSVLDLVQLGSALIRTDRLEEAEQALLAAREMAPRYAKPPAMLGSIYLQQLRFEDAVREYGKAAALGADDFPIGAALHYQLALRELGRDVEARDILERYGQNSDKRFETSLAGHYLGKTSDQELQQSVANRCQSASRHFHLAYQHWLEKRWDAARAEFETARESFKDQYCFTERALTRSRLSHIGALR